MTLNSQQYANLASDSYNNRLPSNRRITIEGVQYKVLDHMDCPSGYQGTIYRRVGTGDIVVAHRGTEFDQGMKARFQDAVLADGGMVLARTNLQEADAVELTRRALEYARKNFAGYQPPPEVTVTGHSLGGTLAQITAHKFHLHGETFNAFGAVSLSNGIPEGGSTVINHVKATDVVSAGSHHYGQVRTYATVEDVRVVRDRAGYSNDGSALDARALGAAAGDWIGAHRMNNFTNVDGNGRPDRSILADPNAQSLAQEYRPMFDKYRNDMYMARTVISAPSTAALDAYGRTREVQGQIAGQTLQAAGHTVRGATQIGADATRAATYVAGATAAAGVVQTGNTAASAREAAGMIEARIDLLQGQAQQQGATLGAGLLRGAGSLLPDGAEQWMDTQADRLQHAGDAAHRRNVGEAAIARQHSQDDAASLRNAGNAMASGTLYAATRVGDLHHDVIAGAGQQISGALNATGLATEALTRRAHAPESAEQQPPSRRNNEAERNQADTPETTHSRANEKAPVVPAAQAAVHESLYPPAQPAPTPAHLCDFRHVDHPRHDAYEKFATGLENAQAGFLQGSNLGRYTPDQHERIAAALTAGHGTDMYFKEVSKITEKDGALWASELKVNMDDKPRGVRIDLANTLAQTPEMHATRWREQHVPAPAPGLVQAQMMGQTQAQTSKVDPQSLSQTDLRHPDHQQHAFFIQTRTALSREYDRWGQTREPEQLDREAGLTAVSAYKEGITDVSGLQMGFAAKDTQGRPTMFLAGERGAHVVLSGDQLAQAPQMDQTNQLMQQAMLDLTEKLRLQHAERQEQEMSQGKGRSV